MTGATPKKRSRVGSSLTTRSDALAAEFNMRNLEPRTDETSCTVMAEAEMLAGHTYATLASNWPPLRIDSRGPEFEIRTAKIEEWDAIVEKQKDVMTVLDEVVVRRARKALMEKMEAVRGSVSVDLQQQPCVYVKMGQSGGVGEVNLTLMALQWMVDLHCASMRVQMFHASVEWLRKVAGFTSECALDFSGGGLATNAALANEVLTAVQGSHPTSTLWWLASGTAVGAQEAVVVPAHLLENNCQDVCMTDDVITVNCIVLARWCVFNRPYDFGVLQCSFFSDLLSTTNDMGIASVAEKELKAAGKAGTSMGVATLTTRTELRWSCTCQPKQYGSTTQARTLDN